MEQHKRRSFRKQSKKKMVKETSSERGNYFKFHLQHKASKMVKKCQKQQETG